LDQYKDPSEEDCKKYLDNSDETSESNNLFVCLILFLLVILLLSSAFFRLLGSDIYIFNKEIEAMMMAKKIQTSDKNSDGSIQFGRADIKTKNDLYEYIIDDFVNNFISAEHLIKEGEPDPKGILELASSLEIKGKIRIHSAKSKKSDDCPSS
jgi:hypothetical protein